MSRHRSKQHHRSHESIEEIIGVSNDESFRANKSKENNELADLNESDTETDDYEDETDYESDDESVTSTKQDKFDETEFTASTVREKKARPHRSSRYSGEEISELKKNKGVQELEQKLNNNLHQIQIAIPYGQLDPQTVPPGVAGYTGVDNSYDLTYGRPKKNKKFYQKCWFKNTMKVIITICLVFLTGFFIWKYYTAMKMLHEQSARILYENERQTMYENENETNPLDEREYDKFGMVGANVKKPNKCNNSKCNLPRDARGRFVKRSK